MNTISKQIGFDYTFSKANDTSIVKGEKYRFTILSNSLIRLEYAEDGVFEDRPSLLVRNRAFKPIPFECTHDEYKLKIETDVFRLTYRFGKPFKGTNLVPDQI